VCRFVGGKLQQNREGIDIEEKRGKQLLFPSPRGSRSRSIVSLMSRLAPSNFSNSKMYVTCVPWAYPRQKLYRRDEAAPRKSKPTSKIGPLYGLLLHASAHR
jgi:hypothetical protein